MLANQGNADALYNLAHMYDIGEGVPKNNDKAIELYTKAAKDSMKEAEYILEIKREYSTENLNKNNIKSFKQHSKNVSHYSNRIFLNTFEKCTT